jgi:hypothetical protein
MTYARANLSALVAVPVKHTKKDAPSVAKVLLYHPRVLSVRYSVQLDVIDDGTAMHIAKHWRPKGTSGPHLVVLLEPSRVVAGVCGAGVGQLTLSYLSTQTA